ncbi:elongation factor Ts, mitochondrial [Cryptococcus depauperatus CBS 7841]|uniref:Elongation factor Ts, mitochondrial n=1 Tax=Cryptococcus depauperatus CBS 7841 TaxID=1295531 RepID=A0A1E3IX10_9TREE|nr:elongation factor Ts, mitochondrial [Cryptococcus depauperatus CBS 7841]
MLAFFPRNFSSTFISRSLSTYPARLAETQSKIPVSLIAALRKSYPVPLAAAREALERSNLDVDAAVDYLRTSVSASAEKKAAKVYGRDTREGVIAISLLGGKRVGMVQLGCETDFVARNEVFLKTARGAAETTAFLDVPGEHEKPKIHVSSTLDPILDFPTESLLSAPLISLPADAGPDNLSPIPTSEPTTIRQCLLSSLSQTGENLRLLRAVSFAAPFPSTPEVRLVPGGYAHGGATDKEGKVGGIVVLSVTSSDEDKPIASLIHGPEGENLEKSLEILARTVARQVVGFPTKSIEKGDRAVEDEEVLMEQPFMMFNGDSRTVREVLKEWGKDKKLSVKVIGLRRWAVGDEIETEKGSEV